jgi:radical SAM-linked protein
MQELFKKAFLRSGLPIQYTSGFNPVPRLEFAGNLAIGIQSEDEVGSCILEEDTAPQVFMTKMNESLPKTIQINNACIFPVTNKRKRESLASSLWGSEYSLKCIDETRTEDFAKNIQLENFSSIMLPFKNDRPLRDLIAKIYGEPYYNIIQLYKTKTIARSFAGELCSYFELYKIIAEINRNLI